MPWTKESVTELLKTSQKAVEHGVLAIFAMQTASEQTTEETKELNGVGFNSADARYMTYIAKWLLTGKHLSGEHVDKARQRILKYAGQLSDIANDNESKKSTA